VRGTEGAAEKEEKQNKRDRGEEEGPEQVWDKAGEEEAVMCRDGNMW
jgi:hypothetical protein